MTRLSVSPTVEARAPICVTCGTHFEPHAEPPAECAICQDERQYVGHDGQQWTALDELRQEHRAKIAEVEPGLVGIGIEPIAISHPHFYSGMVQWAERLDTRILLHEADRRWVMRPSARIEYWSGERCAISPALELHRVGGHFLGGTVVLWRDGAGGKGALLSGDIVQVVEDRDWVSFMWSYPNLIPLPATEVERMAARLAELDFERLHGAWWGAVVDGDAKAKVARSAERYVDALGRYRGTRD